MFMIDVESKKRTNSKPAIHSSTVSSFSRAKSCKCWIKLAVSCLTLGVAFGPVALITDCVKSGLNLCVLPFVTAGACEDISNSVSNLEFAIEATDQMDQGRDKDKETLILAANQ